MRKSIVAASVAAAMAAALSVPSALQARDGASPREGEGSMKGSGMMKDMGQMDQMMDHCSQMMQGASSRPNEQWRDDTPAPGGRTDKNK